MNYGSSTSSWKTWIWVKLDLILTMKDTYINSNLRPFTKFTINSKRTEFKDILPWNIPQVVTKTVTISTRIVISYAIKQFILLRFWWKVNGNWDSNIIRISLLKESRCKTNTSIRRKKEIQKSKTVRVAVRDPRTIDSHLIKVIWDRKNITEFTRSTGLTRMG